MSELSPQARAALKALGAPEPTAADERRVREGFERAMGVVLPAAATVGAVGTVTASTSAAAASASSGAASGAAGFTALGMGAKVVLFVAAVGVGSMVTVGVKTAVTAGATSTPRESVPTQPKQQLERAVVAPPEPEPTIEADPEIAVVAAAPEPVAPTASASPRPARKPTAAVEPPEITAEPEVAVAPTQVDETPDVAPPPAPPAAPTPESATTEDGFELVVEANFPTCDAATELRTAQAARRLLRDQRAEHALFLISAYARHCPSGQWSDEAWRVRLSSLCSLGRNREAASLFEWFATEYPQRRFAIESELRSRCEPSVLDKE